MERATASLLVHIPPPSEHGIGRTVTEGVLKIRLQAQPLGVPYRSIDVARVPRIHGTGLEYSRADDAAPVRTPVAVVVHPVVALLGSPWMDRGLAIVTILRVVGVPDGQVAASRVRHGYAVSVPVAIEVPGPGVRGVCLVGQAVAVIVQAVAQLHSVRVDAPVVVLAIVTGHDRVGWQHATVPEGGDGPVAVSIGVGMIPLVAPNFRQWMPHSIHPLIESGILLASITFNSCSLKIQSASYNII